MFGFWVPRSPTIGAAFADTTKLTAPIKPRPTKRILKLLYRDLPAVRYATAFILFPIQLQGSVHSRVSVKRERNFDGRSRDWARLLRCTECRERDADFVVSGGEAVRPSVPIGRAALQKTRNGAAGYLRDT